MTSAKANAPPGVLADEAGGATSPREAGPKMTKNGSDRNRIVETLANDPRFAGQGLEDFASFIPEDQRDAFWAAIRDARR